MPRFVSPPESEFNNLRQPLTPGERIVFDFFNKHLSAPWEIYVQPHLNGLKPDFVLLNPSVGIAVFEVKDWNLDAMQYEVRTNPDRSPELMARKDGREFSHQDQNPVDKVDQYKRWIAELYCPRLQMPAGYGAITAGIIFPFADDERVNALFEESLKYRKMGNKLLYPISGAESISSGNIDRVFPHNNKSNARHMSELLARDLRNWLVEPDYAATQRVKLKLELDKKQLDLVATRTESGYRRIKGPAGSGKSLVLAARAAQLVSEGKNVLVITFNITLLHYLMDIAVRWNYSKKTRDAVTWLNFHKWCKRVCEESGHEQAYRALWRGGPELGTDEVENPAANSILAEELPRLVVDILQGDKAGSVTRYDAVLVDEGQDMLPLWWDALRSVCKPGGEMLLAADATQDIYDTARSWTDEAMTGAGFRGEWAKLEVSYRLPKIALQYASTFAEAFLPSDIRDLPVAAQAELELYPCDLRWVQTTLERAKDICEQEILLMAPKADPLLLAITDITFLCPNHKIGQEVVAALANKKISAIDTFSSDSREAQRKKRAFFMGDARIKATTLYCFKGWESRAIVIYIGAAMDQKSRALIYTGLTRLKRHEKKSFLTVVSCTNELAAYGKTWPEYEER